MRSLWVLVFALSACGDSSTANTDPSADRATGAGSDTASDSASNVAEWPCAAQVPESVVGVKQYSLDGELVYYFQMDCCDQYNVVYDAACAYVCAPDGGFSGAGDGLCSSFFTDATLIGDVWP